VISFSNGAALTAADPVEIDYREADALPLSPDKAQVATENRHANEKNAKLAPDTRQLLYGRDCSHSDGTRLAVRRPKQLIPPVSLNHSFPSKAKKTAACSR
jgi:hypothetical protein